MSQFQALRFPEINENPEDMYINSAKYQLRELVIFPGSCFCFVFNEIVSAKSTEKKLKSRCGKYNIHEKCREICGNIHEYSIPRDKH